MHIGDPTIGQLALKTNHIYLFQRYVPSLATNKFLYMYYTMSMAHIFCKIYVHKIVLMSADVMRDFRQVQDKFNEGKIKDESAKNMHFLD